ncbi:hypothetical protein KAH94_02990 [bacterium]|nr:hypothetical protein [bacterium]
MKKFLLLGLFAGILFSSESDVRASSEISKEALIVGSVLVASYIGCLTGAVFLGRAVRRWRLYKKIDNYLDGFGCSHNIVAYQLVKSAHGNEKEIALKVTDYYSTFYIYNALMAVDYLSHNCNDLIGFEREIRSEMSRAWLTCKVKNELTLCLDKIIKARDLIIKISGEIKESELFKEQLEERDALNREDIENQIRFTEAQNTDRKVVVQNAQVPISGIVL